MKRFKTLGLRLLAVPVCLVLMGAECPNNNNGNNNNNNNNNGNNNNNTNDNVGRLFVVNNATSVSSFAADANGDVAPLTELPTGASTDLFQPRAIMVTKENVLLVGRQNGGVTSHINALTATGATLSTRITEGTDSKLEAPISFAYDQANDTLYVGNINADEGILVFNNVSMSTFTGDLIPDGKFNPDDRSPTNTTDMTIDAMWLDSDGVLYVSDTSGLNVNRSRVLIFKTPGTASGETVPDGILESMDWANIEDIAVDTLGNLYIVDGTETIKRVDDAQNQTGNVTPDVVLTVPGSLVDLAGITITSENVCYVADMGNDEIHSILNIDTLATSTITPATTISGNDTGLFTPRQLWFVEDVD